MHGLPVYCIIALCALGGSTAPCLGIFIAYILLFVLPAPLSGCVLANMLCSVCADLAAYAAVWAEHFSLRYLLVVCCGLVVVVVLYSAWMCLTVPCFYMLRATGYIHACFLDRVVSQVLHFHAQCTTGCVPCSVYVCSLPYAVFCIQCVIACGMGSVAALCLI